MQALFKSVPDEFVTHLPFQCNSNYFGLPSRQYLKNIGD
ncbi:hypothetical protein F652_1570 [Enterobacteriaceae bacterium bta3-1]|nr:hypothetical protein F652_1570 [Enterobacteriaceae bacterium bta3-1]